MVTLLRVSYERGLYRHARSFVRACWVDRDLHHDRADRTRVPGEATHVMPAKRNLSQDVRGLAVTVNEALRSKHHMLEEEGMRPSLVRRLLYLAKRKFR
jgi:hypothetical protein